MGNSRSDASAGSSLTELDDAELASRIARGDRDAAAALVDRHQGALRGFLRHLTRRPELADDLAQDTFLRVLQSAGRYDPRFPMRTWMFTIARRLWINVNRKADNRATASDFEAAASSDTGPEDLAARADDQRHTRDLLDKALAQLTPTQRQALILAHQQDMPLDQVAQVMDMPVNTIKSHLHRGRAALRNLLAAHHAPGSIEARSKDVTP